MSNPSAQPPVRRRRVLIVDDEDSARRDFATVLEAAGFEVAEAWSVVQAMRMLLSFKPDAVVLDLILPDGHGSDIGRAMGAIVTTRRTCVVAVTRSTATEALDPASFGARANHLKPLAAEALLAAIGECFEPDQARDALRPPDDIAPRLGEIS